MSIYATLWKLKFPKYGDYHFGCEWITVIAQGVPGHIGLQGSSGDSYASFLPPPLCLEQEGVPSEEDLVDQLRAVVFVTPDTPKGTERHGQEYREPLLVLPGQAYESISFADLHDKICASLRGDRPVGVTGKIDRESNTVTIVFMDGTTEVRPLCADE